MKRLTVIALLLYLARGHGLSQLEYCKQFLECENDMMDTHKRCTDGSRNATAEACDLATDFDELSKLMRARVNEFGACVSAESFMQSQKSEEIEIDERECELNSEEQSESPTSCWKSVAQIKRRCQKYQRCCPAAKVCVKSGRTSQVTRAVREKHIIINHKTLECRARMRHILRTHNPNDPMVAKARAVLTSQAIKFVDKFRAKETSISTEMKSSMNPSEPLIPIQTERRPMHDERREILKQLSKLILPRDDEQIKVRANERLSRFELALAKVEMKSHMKKTPIVHAVKSYSPKQVEDRVKVESTTRSASLDTTTERATTETPMTSEAEIVSESTTTSSKTEDSMPMTPSETNIMSHHKDSGSNNPENHQEAMSSDNNMPSTTSTPFDIPSLPETTTEAQKASKIHRKKHRKHKHKKFSTGIVTDLEPQKPHVSYALPDSVDLRRLRLLSARPHLMNSLGRRILAPEKRVPLKVEDSEDSDEVLQTSTRATTTKAATTRQVDSDPARNSQQMSDSESMSESESTKPSYTMTDSEVKPPEMMPPSTLILPSEPADQHSLMPHDNLHNGEQNIRIVEDSETHEKAVITHQFKNQQTPEGDIRSVHEDSVTKLENHPITGNSDHEHKLTVLHQDIYTRHDHRKNNVDQMMRERGVKRVHIEEDEDTRTSYSTSRPIYTTTNPTTPTESEDSDAFEDEPRFTKYPARQHGAKIHLTSKTVTLKPLEPEDMDMKPEMIPESRANFVAPMEPESGIFTVRPKTRAPFDPVMEFLKRLRHSNKHTLPDRLKQVRYSKLATVSAEASTVPTVSSDLTEIDFSTERPDMKHPVVHSDRSEIKMVQNDHSNMKMVPTNRPDVRATTGRPKMIDGFVAFENDQDLLVGRRKPQTVTPVLLHNELDAPEEPTTEAPEDTTVISDGNTINAMRTMAMLPQWPTTLVMEGTTLPTIVKSTFGHLDHMRRQKVVLLKEKPIMTSMARPFMAKPTNNKIVDNAEPQGYRNKVYSAQKLLLSQPEKPLSEAEVLQKLQRTKMPDIRRAPIVNETPIKPAGAHELNGDFTQAQSDLVRNLEEFVNRKVYEMVEKDRAQHTETELLQSLRMTKAEFEAMGKKTGHCELYSTCSDLLKSSERECRGDELRFPPELARRKFGSCNARLWTQYQDTDKLRLQLVSIFESCLVEDIAIGNARTPAGCAAEWPILPEFPPESTCTTRTSLIRDHCVRLGKCCTSLKRCRQVTDDNPLSLQLLNAQQDLAHRAAKCQNRGGGFRALKPIEMPAKRVLLL
ncbi:unnamed protein product [Bursaphelenchus okinawaensis]|uniref:Uncharacterized protein n=1 Tax=Bursaphelenchus okinawaensis TaxID=465554 RepID=A0A811KBT9_9BILA|nr:unnamed protein product [Bursaphelenchus okinawaensis]CAG9095726.1 unnamed protein product [Bursaphelenchus okinawaensis]